MGRLAKKDGKGQGEKEEIDGLQRPAVFFNSRNSEHSKISRDPDKFLGWQASRKAPGTLLNFNFLDNFYKL
jgi:hypothetical protein